MDQQNLIILAVFLAALLLVGFASYRWIRRHQPPEMKGSGAEPLHEVQKQPQPTTGFAPAQKLEREFATPVPEEQKPAVPGKTKAEPADLKRALSKTRDSLWGRIRPIFSQAKTLSVSEFENLEEVLYTSDLGPQTVQQLLTSIQERLSPGEQSDLESVREALKSEMLGIFQGTGVGQELKLGEKPSVWMIVGVNGAGKTTTIGKVAAQLAGFGKKVLVAAGDTFRAAAGEQLRIWTERARVEIFDPSNVKDPSAVAFDAVQKALSDKYDLVLIDTAGRLHTAKNLMEELKKMKRVIQKVMPSAPQEILLVLDANSGQNALNQAREFHSALSVTGVILTKLDGSAKGGVAVGVACELHLPIRLIGVGEKIGDLREFSASEFIESIL